MRERVLSSYEAEPHCLNHLKGFHDIVTVIFLTLPPELQLACAEKMSLHRLRDSMGKGLEPLLGLLRCVSSSHVLMLYILSDRELGRILKYLFRLADPSYAELLEQ